MLQLYPFNFLTATLDHDLRQRIGNFHMFGVCHFHETECTPLIKVISQPSYFPNEYTYIL